MMDNVDAKKYSDEEGRGQRKWMKFLKVEIEWVAV